LDDSIVFPGAAIIVEGLADVTIEVAKADNARAATAPAAAHAQIVKSR
jgi:hypothetical protein